MLSALMNQLLTAENHRQLQGLSGKSFSLQLEEFQQPWVFHYDGQRFSQQSYNDQELIAVKLRGNIAGFSAFIQRQPPPPDGRLIFEGDLYLGQQLQEALKNLRPDWEQLLRQRLGDGLGGFVYGSGQQLKAGADNLARRLFLTEEEFAPFRADLADLERRLADLERQVNRVPSP